MKNPLEECFKEAKRQRMAQRQQISQQFSEQILDENRSVELVNAITLWLCGPSKKNE